jgi:hypothetical protein
MKYNVVNERNPFYGKIFDGKPCVIAGEKRIWNNETTGQSYPETDCNIELEESQIQQLVSLHMHFPYRICFAVFVDGEFRTYAETTKRKMNGFAKLGYPVFKLAV